jgi:hypothetical protein
MAEPGLGCEMNVPPVVAVHDVFLIKINVHR